jgi:mRNA interferase MazF
MTTKGRKYPTRIPCSFQGKKGQIIVDQVRTIDKKRLVKRLGIISKKAQNRTLTLLQDLFAP